MKAGVLFSGGKDSAMAAIMLSREYDVELNTYVFDENRVIGTVERAAEALGFPFKKRIFGLEFLEEVARMIVKSGYPNDAINYAHRMAITGLCREYPVIGDGTRLNDRVPMLAFGDVQSMYNRYGCSYVRPLLGYGKPEVDRFVSKYLAVQYGETGEIENGDYEREIRDLLREQGFDLGALFPARHQQSLVIGLKKYMESGKT